MRRFLIIFLLLANTANCYAKSLSLTFDDGLNPDEIANASHWNEQLLAALKSANVTAMIFPSLQKIGDGDGHNLIKNWSEAGHAVGNHTSKHRSLGSKKVQLSDFINDVKEADEALHALPTWKPMLRFPFLKEGNTTEKRDGIRTWMRQNNYHPAPISIDTSDWYFNQIFLEVSEKNDQEKIEKLQQKYIEHLIDRANYYDKLANQVFHRSPSHVMLLHVNAINAKTIHRVITAFRAQGWSIIPPTEAYQDQIYLNEPNTLPAGESIIWASAKELGIKGLRYPAEDAVYEEAGLQALGLTSKPQGG